MTVTHSYALLELKLIQKIIFLLKMKARGLGKGHQRLMRGHAGGSWIFSEFDYRHLVELEYKIFVYHQPPSGTFSNLHSGQNSIAYLPLTKWRFDEQQPQSPWKIGQGLLFSFYWTWIEMQKSATLQSKKTCWQSWYIVWHQMFWCYTARCRHKVKKISL